MFGLGVFQSIRNNTIKLEKLNVINSSLPHLIDYNMNGKGVSGFIFSYDKIYFALGFKTSNTEESKKGKSKNQNIALQLNGNKLVIEAGYRNYRGFYDASTPVFIQGFSDTTPYFRNESLQNKNLKIKALYFLNHKKFSYNSAYFGSFRQLKSAFSWILNGNLYFSKIQSDSTVIPFYAHDIFAEYGELNGIRVTAFSLGGGGSANLIVFKRFFYNATITLAAEPQFRKYTFLNNSSTTPFYISVAADLRSSFGYNSRKFFLLFSVVNDLTFNKNRSLTVNGNFFTTSFAVGYRFHFENKSTKWLKANKLYQMI